VSGPLPIRVYLIARTALTHDFNHWLASEHGVDQESLGMDRQFPGANLVGAAAKNCYRSFEPGLNPNVTKVRRDWVDYFDHVLSSGHGSVLEHSTYSFALEGVTRVFTAEMNRHRAGWAISERSLRYYRLDDLNYWMPESLYPLEDDSQDLRERKARTAEILRETFERAEETYRELNTLWEIEKLPFHEKKKLTSLFRRIVPMGVSTAGVWTGNARALRHVIATRAVPEAEEEIAVVFSQIGKIMVEQEPLLFGDFSEENGYYTPKYRKV